MSESRRKNCFNFSELKINLNIMEQEEKKQKRQPCEIYSRVVGYIRPVNQFNPGKRSEFHDRKYTKVSQEKEAEPAEQSKNYSVTESPSSELKDESNFYFSKTIVEDSAAEKSSQSDSFSSHPRI